MIIERKTKAISQTQLYLRLYYWFNVLITLCVGLFFGMAMMNDPEVESDPDLFWLLVFPLILFMVALVGFFAAMLLFIDTRKKWAYYAQIIPIGIGLTSLLTLIPAVLLMLRWVNDEYKAYYTGEDFAAGSKGPGKYVAVEE